MKDLIFEVEPWLLAVLGVPSLLVLAAAALYMLEGLRRQRRYAALALALAGVAFAFTTPGAWVVVAACGAVALVQAGSYAYFTLRTLLGRARGRALRVSAKGPRGSSPSVTLVIPAKDEGRIIATTLRSLDRLEYPSDLLELVLVDDGSTDDTREIAATLSREMRHRLRIVHHEVSGGKARRLNEITQSAGSELMLVMDADHCVEPQLLNQMLAHLDGAPDVACVQAASAVRNASTNLLTKLLEVEYLFRCRGIYPGKRIGMFFGSGGLFRRSALLEVGGFATDMLTEDVEISYRFYKAGKRIVYDDSLSSYDLAPEDFRNFFNQRHRWMRGLWQAMLLHLRERESRSFSAKIRAYFVQFTIDGFGAFCLSVLEMYAFLELIGVVGFSLRLPMYLMLGSSACAFALGTVRGGKALNLLYLPLVPLYMIAHSIPMAWALVDNYVLGKPFVWVKTERASETPANVGLSRGTA